MFLKEIRLKNFRCHADLYLSFKVTSKKNRKWTLILGENGTGKSNILKAIALVTAGSNALGELIGDSDSWISFGKENCIISAVLLTDKGQERKIELILRRGDSLSQIVTNNRDTLRLIDDALEHTDRNYFVAAYGASRKLPHRKERSRQSFGVGRTMNLISLFDSSSPLNDLNNWIVDLDYRSGGKGYELISIVADKFLPGVNFHSIDKKQRTAMFRTADGIIPLDQLSDGYQNMAGWIGDLLYRITERFDDYKNPLKARGLLLIDEIDLHLHPYWQRNLIQFLSINLPNFQIVATTHSPLTAQQADEGELFALVRDIENNILIQPFKGSPKNLLVSQLMMTPLFGLESDESLEIQSLKNNYKELSSIEKLSNEQQKELKRIKRKLGSNLPTRMSNLNSERELELLSKIEQHLNIEKP